MALPTEEFSTSTAEVHGAPIKNFFNNVKQISKLFKGFKLPLVITLIFALGATCFSVIGPKLLAYATNEIFYGLKDSVDGIGSINFENTFMYLFIAAIIFIFASICQAIQNIICTNISRKVCYDLRKCLIEKISKLPIGYFESQTKGNIISRVINDVDNLASNISNVFIDTVTAVTMLFGSLIMMFIINAALTLVIVFLIPVSFLIVLLIVRRSQQHFVNIQNNLGKVNGFVEENFAGHSVVQIYNKQKEAVKDFEKLNQDLYKESIRASIISQIAGPLFSIIQNIAYVAVVIFGAFLTIVGSFTVGDILAFTQYVNSFSNPIKSLMSIFNIIQAMAASSQRIQEFLEVPDDANIESGDKIDANIYDTWPDDKPVIKFENVIFSYDKKTPIINNFSLDIYKGQTVAIVGPTGAGKTTLIKLLMRFYDIDGGKISIFGQDISTAKKIDVCKNMAMVLQDIWLFSGSIGENIRYGDDRLTDKAIQNAAVTACADFFISRLKDKYDTPISEGAKNFSLGQKQLISIARAIAADREIMIMDEATSSVDTATEEQLYEAFNTLINKKTSIVIAHRLSTIRNADTILVLNNGDIVEQGTHETLLAQHGFYHDLISSAKH